MSRDLLDAVRDQDSLVDIAYFLDYDGANINYQDENGYTALMEAAMYLDIVRMRFLLGRQASVDIVDNENKTALNHVCANYDKKSEDSLYYAIELLLISGANPKHNSGTIEPLLNWAASNNYIKIAAHTLAAHDYTEDELWTALFQARHAGHQDMEELLGKNIYDSESETENTEQAHVASPVHIEESTEVEWSSTGIYAL